jgi:hypothetical protein
MEEMEWRILISRLNRVRGPTIYLTLAGGDKNKRKVKVCFHFWQKKIIESIYQRTIPFMFVPHAHETKSSRISRPCMAICEKIN